jgi:NAD(P)-dependent dehydrogenase (short-subunit alcohol dehydrogenase family)
MAKTIIIGGFGPGISTAVAEKFGAAGFSIALVARNAERVAAGAKALAAKGIRAEAFPADLSKPADIRAMVGKVRAALGPISVLQWSAYTGGAGDLTTATADELAAVIGIATSGLTTAVQATLPDLVAEKGAVLVTNGGLGFFDPKIDAVGVEWNVMGLSVANSAKHKLVALLAHKLKAQGVYVGEVVVTGTVKGSAFDAANNGTIEPTAISAKFWDMFQSRSPTSTTI